MQKIDSSSGNVQPFLPTAHVASRSRPAQPPIQAADNHQDDASKIIPCLLSISKSMRALIGLKLHEEGFHNGQDELLLALDERVVVSVSQLAEKLCVRPSTVSKMMDRLVGKGMIQRMGDVHDARRTMVQITTAGLEAQSRLFDMREKLETELRAACADDPALLKSMEFLSNILQTRLSRIR